MQIYTIISERKRFYAHYTKFLKKTFSEKDKKSLALMQGPLIYMITNNDLSNH